METEEAMTRRNKSASTDGAHDDAQSTTTKKRGVSKGKHSACELPAKEALVGKFDHVEALASQEEAMTALRQLSYDLARKQLELGALLGQISLMKWYGEPCWVRTNYEARFGDFCMYVGVAEEDAHRLMEIQQVTSATRLTWGDVETLGWPKLRLIVEKALAADASPEEIDWLMSHSFDPGECSFVDLDEWINDDFSLAGTWQH